MDSLAAASGGRESPSSKRRKIRPKIDQDYTQSTADPSSAASFTPRIENVVTMVKL